MTAAADAPVYIESLDQEGRGVGRIAGKTVFVEGALPGERVRVRITRRRPTFDLASVSAIEHRSSFRVEPRCPHFDRCGGCSLQHLDPSAQVAVKQRTLEDTFWHIGRLRPQRILAPIHGPSWGYRNRARMGVRYVPKKGGALVGFHERRSGYIADMDSCEVMPPRISALLVPLRRLVDDLSIRDRLPQIELALGDAVDVLVLRNLLPLSENDRALVRSFADRHAVSIWLQPAGPDSARPYHPPEDTLGYSLPDFAVRFAFGPTEFTQVNGEINRALVRRAVSLLGARSSDRVADLFCGLGNFTLPIARCGAEVVGVEGSEALLHRARANAAANGLDSRVEFRAADLFVATSESIAALGTLDRLLIDPPREGALAVVRALAAGGVQRIVYVSCNPATLARDAAVLVHDKGFELRAAGVINMFPHTAHVESIAVFEPG